MMYENSQPILRVEDMRIALDFYVGKLGFANAAWGNDDFTRITCDGADIYLCKQGQGDGKAWLWVGVTDAGKLHEQLKAAGVKIRMEPTNFSYAYEFHAEDPDGNVLRFGSDPK